MSETSLCQKVEEELSQILDGSASAELFDHIANCDACRDARYEAERGAELAKEAGEDFREPAGFVDQLLARIDAERPEGPVLGPSDPAPVSRVPVTRPGDEARDTRDSRRGKVTTDGVSAATHRTPLVVSEPAPRSGKRKLDTREAIEEALEDEAEAEPVPSRVASKPSRKEPAPKKDARDKKVVFFRRPAFALGVAGLVAAAAGVGLYYKERGPTQASSQELASWSGTVEKVARASADKTGGLVACNASSACAPIEGGASFSAGTTLRTDARTRARVSLADGSVLALDRDSEIAIDAQAGRHARIKRGTVVADVAHVDGQNAHFAFAQGEVEVLGTKLSITTTDTRASVEVARGAVRLSSAEGDSVEVRAGEEATLFGGRKPVVASSSSIADVMEWSDQSPEEIDAPLVRGLGELRARKPGQTKEKDHAVRLAKHAVKVRIVDLVARTEVDETFTNDTDEELEGIFRFPLPPGAQIEKLALEVDGKLIEGAFVDRDQGAAIWRGVIQNAAPKAPRPREEIIWVPGPWRDPALLEWQRGGRFELKIFPIPKRGSRRVVLTYTQVVEQAAGMRRFTYPLAHDPSGTTTIDSFDIDLQVRGLDKTIPLATRGYEMLAAGGEGERRTLHADRFIPAGDLTVEYALPDRDKEVTAWAYRMPAAEAEAPASALKAKTSDEKAAREAAAALIGDDSPYVAIALRPTLPRWQEARERLHVLVVDASRSMVGERFARARRLASSIVREMDRRDSFLLLACDTTCRSMSGEGGAATSEAPSAAAVERVERFLGSIEPDGGSDLSAAISAARAAAGSASGKELRVLYLGDGTPTVGPTRPSHLETAVRSLMPSGEAALVAVALGADADMRSLEALARGGGGVVVPYVPGQRISSAALEVLSAAYGVTLRDPELELPPGLVQVSPGRLDPLRAGGETLVVARMSHTEAIEGTLRLKGRVSGERFEQSYPLKVVASQSAGNAFVPRLFAAARIAELERSGGSADKAMAIELSKRFLVASRFTSLLVLESEAMFKAFGLDRNGIAPVFTGDVDAESASADAEGEEAKDEDDLAGNGFGSGHGRLGGGGVAAPKAKKATGASRGDSLDGLESEIGLLGGAAGPMPTPAPTMAAPAQEAPNDPFALPPPPAKPRPNTSRPAPDRWRRPPRRMIPMRKVFDRKASFASQNTFVSDNVSKLVAAESALELAPDSRDKTVALYTLYATSGRLNEAEELSARWSGRDALDPEALIARADLSARRGDRARALRILGGLSDVRPGDRAAQTRLADLRDAAGEPALACEHRITLADMAPGDAKLVADAVRCARSQGMIELASALERDAEGRARDALSKLLAAPAPAEKALRGDVQLTAEWSGGADLDIALIDESGKRTSWLGSALRASVTARDATSRSRESLALAGLSRGQYLIEIARAEGGDSADPIRGELTLKLPGGESRKIPFTLTSSRAEVGTLRVFFTSRLVPVNQVGFGWSRGKLAVPF